jgi:hypothetical protein
MKNVLNVKLIAVHVNSKIIRKYVQVVMEDIILWEIIVRAVEIIAIHVMVIYVMVVVQDFVLIMVYA